MILSSTSGGKDVTAFGEILKSVSKRVVGLLEVENITINSALFLFDISDFHAGYSHSPDLFNYILRRIVDSRRVCPRYQNRSTL
ncbi:hypothetical protein SLEP1_g17920 [Rubroshorea leprosula]|uniref:Uncharacterized protein n=1 Tax=Rubroshorea leprosula TaxID=152421 RepID=A0AAV5J1C2_9ROSI|nr:hypothetical protein SLEP1_g17920 [Rubroshorea leprosula]